MTYKRLNWQNEHETCPCRQNFSNSSIFYLIQLRLRQLAEINQIIDSKQCQSLALSLKLNFDREKLIEMLELP
jgi:hypothetical protein